MRLLSSTGAVIAVAALALACGHAGNLDPQMSSQLRAARAGEAVPSYLSGFRKDRDHDADRNDDDQATLSWGSPAATADRRSSVALVRRYFAAAVAGDGRAGCKLLVPIIAESVAEENGHSPGLRGKTCPVVLAKLFRRFHAQLAKKDASLRIASVRVEGNKAMAVLDFPSIHLVRLMRERRVGHRWRLLVLLDGILE